jgi:hypothetical protein
MARVLNKIINLLTNSKQKLSEDKPERNGSGLAEEKERMAATQGIQFDSSLEEPMNTQESGQLSSLSELSEKDQRQVEEYCDEKKVKYKLMEVSFMLDEMDKVLVEFRKLSHSSKKRESLLEELIEGVKDTEYALTEVQEISLKTKKCVGETKDMAARADFILRACKHICSAEENPDIADSLELSRL